MLADHQLKKLLTPATPLVSEFPGKWSNLAIGASEWNGASSPIQPCSIDLHIGEIFIPGTEKGKLGSVGRGAPVHRLPSGHSVVVRSYENVSLPNNVGAIALPPSSVSSKGIFVANFGHIDPGYEGHMRFTIINMGKDEYPLVNGE